MDYIVQFIEICQKIILNNVHLHAQNNRQIFRRIIFVSTLKIVHKNDLYQFNSCTKTSLNIYTLCIYVYGKILAEALLILTC